jgi:hypothetical protein
MTTALYKNHFYNLRQTFYNTDTGYVFQDNMVENFYEFDQTTLSIDLLNAGQLSQGNFGTLYIRNSDHLSIYKRQYKKLQDVLANVGGLVNAILLFSRLLSNFITRKFVWVDLFEYFAGKENFVSLSLNNMNIKPFESHNVSDIKLINLPKNNIKLKKLPRNSTFCKRYNSFYLGRRKI